MHHQVAMKLLSEYPALRNYRRIAKSTDYAVRAASSPRCLRAVFRDLAEFVSIQHHMRNIHVVLYGGCHFRPMY